jgi:hypothetical protein
MTSSRGTTTTGRSSRERTIKRLIEASELRPVQIRSATRIPHWELERYARGEWAAENDLGETPRPTGARAAETHLV